MIDMSLDVQLEALLFYKATAQKKTTLLKALDVTAEALQAAIQALRARLEHGALCVIETDTEVQLATNPAVTPFIETVRKDELKSDIGKAGAETLAIVLYREPVSRAELDRIRGVNSSTIVRNLLVRGLIVREQSGHTTRLRPSPELLSHLGITAKHELPEFGDTMNKLEAFEANLETSA
jgi:segregation and condensation protein B